MTAVSSSSPQIKQVTPLPLNLVGNTTDSQPIQATIARIAREQFVEIPVCTTGEYLAFKTARTYQIKITPSEKNSSFSSKALSDLNLIFAFGKKIAATIKKTSDETIDFNFSTCQVNKNSQSSRRFKLELIVNNCPFISQQYFFLASAADKIPQSVPFEHKKNSSIEESSEAPPKKRKTNPSNQPFTASNELASQLSPLLRSRIGSDPFFWTLVSPTSPIPTTARVTPSPFIPFTFPSNLPPVAPSHPLESATKPQSDFYSQFSIQETDDSPNT